MSIYSIEGHYWNFLTLIGWAGSSKNRRRSKIRFHSITSKLYLGRSRQIFSHVIARSILVSLVRIVPLAGWHLGTLLHSPGKTPPGWISLWESIAAKSQFLAGIWSNGSRSLFLKSKRYRIARGCRNIGETSGSILTRLSKLRSLVKCQVIPEKILFIISKLFIPIEHQILVLKATGNIDWIRIIYFI